MRIVAGSLGGRSLVAPRGHRVRPTSERVREAVFSALGEIGGATVADLYCGTGAMGIEAISRGAAAAVMVDRDLRPSLGNVRNLGIDDRVELVRGDPARWIATAPAGRFDLVFIDPPYRLADRVGNELDKHLAGLLAPGGLVVAESGAGSPLQLASLPVVRERRYGRALITFHERPE